MFPENQKNMKILIENSMSKKRNKTEIHSEAGINSGKQYHQESNETGILLYVIDTLDQHDIGRGCIEKACPLEFKVNNRVHRSAYCKRKYNDPDNGKFFQV